MFYYKYKYELTNIYNLSMDLNVAAIVHIYTDEGKTDFLMQMPFTNFPFSEIPNKTIEGINEYVEQKIEEQMQQWTQRFEELKLLKELGLYQPVEPQIQFETNIEE